MRFKGQLLLPGESGPGLKVNLDVAEHHLAVESDGGGLGAWPLEVVEVERLRGDIFTLTVAGEPLRFVADDTIAFAYSAVPAIERVVRRSRGRSGLRSVLDRIWKGPGQAPRPVGKETPPADEKARTQIEDPPPPADDPVTEASDTLARPQAPEPRVEPKIIIDEPVVERPTQWPRSPDPEPIQPPRSPAPEPQEAAEAVPGETQCPAVRSDGRRCESQILTESGYCYPHDPRRAVEDGYQAAQEARAQLKRDATARLNRIYSRLDKAMRQVERGELDPDTAMAMAQLAKTMCAILEMDERSADEG